jgi:hypothetical protein
MRGKKSRGGNGKDMNTYEGEGKYIHDFAVETDRRRLLGRPRL